LAHHAEGEVALEHRAARLETRIPTSRAWVRARATSALLPAFSQAVTMLERAGIRYARGFSLNTAGRPWLVGCASSFDLQRALGLASSTPL